MPDVFTKRVCPVADTTRTMNVSPAPPATSSRTVDEDTANVVLVWVVTLRTITDVIASVTASRLTDTSTVPVAPGVTRTSASGVWTPDESTTNAWNESLEVPET